MKSLHEVVSFLRSNMIALPESFSVEGIPFGGFSDDRLREGVAAFREYTHDLYTFFMDNSQAYDRPLKTAKGDFPSLAQGYPILLNAFLVLYLLGCSGIPSDEGTALLVNGKELRESARAMRLSKIGDIIALLRDQGMEIEGDAAKSETLTLANPTHRPAPLGLAAMAQASRRYAKKPADKEVVADRFMMRFDYHVLSGAKNPTAPIDECLNAAPLDIREFLTQLTGRFAAEGCKLQMTSKLFNSKCALKPKGANTIFFTIHADFGRYWIKINAEHLAEYVDILKDAPEAIRTFIQDERWPCAKKSDPSACSPLCRGGVRFTFNGEERMPCRMGAFQLPIENSAERNFALRWIDTELAAT